MRGQLCAVLMLLCGAVLTEEAIVDCESTIKLIIIRRCILYLILTATKL